MKRSIAFFVFLVLMVSGAYAQSFRANNILYDVDDVYFLGSISYAEFSTLTDRVEMRALETALQQNVFAPSGLRMTSFSITGNRTTAEDQIVRWAIDNCLPLQGHRIGDTYRVIVTRNDQASGYVLVFNFGNNGLWYNLMFSFTYRDL